MRLATIPAEGQAVLRIDLDRILDNPYQYRRTYNDEDLAELATNIRHMAEQLPETSGLQSPPLARLVYAGNEDVDITPLHTTSKYDLMDPTVRCQLLFGHRRLRAFRLLAAENSEHATMPIYLVDATDEQMWQAAISENTQRRDVSAIDEAISLQKAMLEFGLTAEEAGQPFGWSRSTVANKIRLLDLPAAYLDAVAAGTISESAGRTLLMLAKAPHLLLEGTFFAVEKLADLSRRDLENLIKRTVCTLQPVAPEKTPTTGYNRPRWGDQWEIEKFAPPPFPFEWMPSPADDRVIGPCGGCRFLVTFAGEAGPRCAENRAAVCYSRKTVLWEQREFNRQRSAVATPPTQPAAAATPPPATGQRPTPTPSAVKAAPQMAAYDNKEDRTITWFGSDYHAPARLIDEKLCGEQQCECFVLAYRKDIDDYNRDKLVRPDAANAPNLCYGCTSTTRLANRRQKLEHGLDVSDKRKAERQASADTEQRLRDALETYTPEELWSSTTFMRSVAQTNIGWQSDPWPLEKLQAELWIAAAAVKCKKLSKYSSDLYVWQPDLAEAWLQSIRSNEVQP